MLFNSLEFFIFFIIVYVCYLSVNFRLQNYLLLVASYVFYGAWDWRFLGLLFVSTSLDYFLAIKVDEIEDRVKRKIFVVFSIIVNLVILGFFKYFNFFIDSFHKLFHVFGINVPLPALNIILPIGISFYTFQSMSYVIDVYRKEIKPTRKWLEYAVFVSFFPHLVAGPIMRARQLLSQVVEPRIVTLNKFYEGCFLFFWGLFEKIFVADNLAKIVNPVFVGGISGPGYNGVDVLVALYAFAFQIFCDFDGYSNMARGLGKCLGFEIIINFNLPYFATNPREFWQRWHISLSGWLKDYLYVSLGGNRGAVSMTFRNLSMTMVLGGLWHGASWTFVLWGAYHGLLLIGHRLIASIKRQVLFAGGSSQGWFIVKVIIFFHLVVLGWLLFRAQSLTQVGEMLRALIFNFHVNEQNGFLFLKFIAIISLLFVIQIGQYKTKDLLFLYHRHWLVKTAAYALMTCLMIGWGAMKAEEFIYFQF